MEQIVTFRHVFVTNERQHRLNQPGGVVDVIGKGVVAAPEMELNCKCLLPERLVENEFHTAQKLTLQLKNRTFTFVFDSNSGQCSWLCEVRLRLLLQRHLLMTPIRIIIIIIIMETSFIFNHTKNYIQLQFERLKHHKISALTSLVK